MELNQFWAAMWRRWYLTILGVALALGVTALMVIKIGPTYKAEGTMLLFPPTSTKTSNGQLETQGNPYLQLGGLSQARDVVIRAFDAQSVQEEFARQEPNAAYELAPDYTTSGPLIIIDVSAPTPAAAVSGLRTVMTMVPQTLKSLQAGLDLPQSAYITAVKLTADSNPEVVRSGQVRTGIVVAAVSMTAAFFLIGLLDGLLTGRARRGPGRPERKRGKGQRAPTDSPSSTEPREGQAGAPESKVRSTAPPSSSVPEQSTAAQHDPRHAWTGSR